ncbi:DinB family protein [Fodinisporobacter ferrooxydans]|uniref:DinB family protein n=1 Tax=Fodinisporobacter ferrooxydans TaxID=2901836 RepID=A0ABY4CF78_9BACL|nr:DinB family protein [Alicyclobacillaceae bacterium MYW30-H2]
MFQTLNGFLQSWEYEAGATQKLLDALTDASLRQEVASMDRTLGRIAWHIVTAIHEMMSRTGLQFASPGEDGPVPTSAKVIADAYRQVNDAFVQALQTQWTDSTLKEMHNLYGEEWPNGITLMVLIRHQIHHRGQMTVLMRQAGLKVPGVYGPAREEWANLGMEAPKL